MFHIVLSWYPEKKMFNYLLFDIRHIPRPSTFRFAKKFADLSAWVPSCTKFSAKDMAKVKLLAETLIAFSTP